MGLKTFFASVKAAQDEAARQQSEGTYYNERRAAVREADAAALMNQGNYWATQRAARMLDTAASIRARL